MTRLLLLGVLALTLLPQSAAALDTTLVAQGSVWRYRDDGSDQGTAWRAPAFDDSAWSSGAAQLGYGDGDEQTIVSYGPDANQKYVTTYFRRAFNVADPSFTSLTLRTLRDDGAVVYLNGTEVWRSNLPAGTITSQTLATDAGTGESTFFPAAIDPALLVAGSNVLAVEVHQSSRSSSDLSFDLELVASDAPPQAHLTRGPYLQLGTPNSIRIRWRTDIATNSRVRYGTAPDALETAVDDSATTKEHEVVLNGLAPRTRYYYSIGSTTQTLAGDASHTFLTAPTPGTSMPVRIWAIGDSGTADANAAAVRNAYLAHTGNTPTNLWLMLGDNAYTYGTDEEYQWAVFDMYPTLLRSSVVWPTLGNHDTAEVAVAPPDLPYFAMFSLPTGGEAGGVASGTEKYYSFDYANIHFICLDSMTSNRQPGGPMLAWLRNDLEATSQPWIIAYWHHPPYSKGSHDSDLDIELTEMRRYVLPVLEDYGVDVVLSGHSHSYERSYLIDSHYGVSSTFVSSMKKDGGNGRPSGTGAYTKPTVGAAPHEGAVYVVAGSSGLTSGGPLNHPAMFIGLNNLGSLVLDVNGRRLDAKFLREDGTIGDSFTIIKGFVAAPGALAATAPASSRIDLTWTDNATNEQGFRIERCTGSASACDEAPALFGQIAQTPANSTSFSDATPTSGTTYSYRVRAFNDTTESTYSNTAQAVTPPPLSAPTLSAVAASSSRIDLSWVVDSTTETGFRIERCTGTAAACAADPSSFTQIAQVGSAVDSYADTERATLMTYSYRVRAFNAGETGPYSNIAAAMTLASCAPAPVITAQPAPATVAAGGNATLVVRAISTAQMSFQWYSGPSGNDAQPLAGETKPMLAIAPPATASYWVRVRSDCGITDSAAATVTVGN